MLQNIDNLLFETESPKNTAVNKPQQVGVGYCHHQFESPVTEICDINDSICEGQGIDNGSDSLSTCKTL